MPKMKTHKGAAKRIKITGSGKLMRRKAFTSHILEKKSPKRKRQLSKPAVLSKANVKAINALLGR